MIGGTQNKRGEGLCVPAAKYLQSTRIVYESKRAQLEQRAHPTALLALMGQCTPTRVNHA